MDKHNKLLNKNLTREQYEEFTDNLILSKIIKKITNLKFNSRIEANMCISALVLGVVSDIEEFLFGEINEEYDE